MPLPRFGYWFCVLGACTVFFERSAIDRYVNKIARIIENNCGSTTLSIIPFIVTMSFVF
jgi:hypothetical protein